MGVVGVILVFSFAVRLVNVDGPSMRQTLQNGDRLLVVNSVLSRRCQPGDIVVVRKESFLHDPIIKRVIAVGGQTVDIDFSSGGVYVDGALLTEPYIAGPTTLDEGTRFPLTVPEGSVFVMGDNRGDSRDSRDPSLGAVDVRCVIGRAVFLAFPGVSASSGKRELSRIGAVG